MNWTTSYASDFYYDALGDFGADTQAIGFFKADTMGYNLGSTSIVFAGLVQDDNNMNLRLMAGGDSYVTVATGMSNFSRHEIRLLYDPTAGDYGRLSCTFDGNTSHLYLTEAQRNSGATFDTFGLWAPKHSGWTAGSGECKVYYDNLAFTVPEPSALGLCLTAVAGLLVYAYRRKRT